MNKVTEANFFMPLGIILIGLTPVIMVLLPWDFGNQISLYRGFMRVNSLSVTVVEILFLLLAMRLGFSPAAALAALPRLTKAGAFLILLVATWSTIWVSASPFAAIIGMIKIFLHLMFVLAIANQFLDWTPRERNQIWLTIGYGVVIYCVLWIISIVVYRPSGEEWIWLVPGLTNIRWIGFFALASFCAGIGSLPANSDASGYRRQLFVALFFCTIGLGIAFWTGTRGAVVAILVATTSALLRTMAWRKILPLVFLATFIALLISSALPVVHPSYGLNRIINSSTSSKDITGLSQGRIAVWTETLKKIKERPFAGWGIDQFRYSGPEDTLGYRHPHQGVLQLLFSMGFLGVLAMLMIVIPFVKRFPRKLSLPHEWAALAYFSGAIIYGLYDGFFYYPFSVMIFLISVACLQTATLPQPASGRSD
jgi:O-antigen ligase